MFGYPSKQQNISNKVINDNFISTHKSYFYVPIWLEIWGERKIYFSSIAFRQAFIFGDAINSSPRRKHVLIDCGNISLFGRNAACLGRCWQDLNQQRKPSIYLRWVDNLSSTLICRQPHNGAPFYFIVIAYMAHTHKRSNTRNETTASWLWDLHTQSP